MFCKKCGAKIKDGSRFCKMCGASTGGFIYENKIDVQRYPEEKKSSQKAKTASVFNRNAEYSSYKKTASIRKKNTGRLLLIAVVAGVFIALGIIVAFVITRRNSIEQNAVEERKETIAIEDNIDHALVVENTDTTEIEESIEEEIELVEIKNINQFLAQYGISRVFIFDEDVFNELYNSTEKEPYMGFNTYFSKRYFNYAPDSYNGYPLMYTFHGDKEKEQETIDELKRVIRGVKNFQDREELKYAIEWLENDVKSVRLMSIHNSISEIDEGYNSSIGNSKIEYDDVGRPVCLSMYQYHSDTILRMKIYSDYNEDGYIERVCVDFYNNSEDNNFRQDIEYAYSYDGNMICELSRNESNYDYDEPEMIASKDVSTYRYNKDGDIFTLEYFGSPDVFHYDENGELTNIDGEYSSTEYHRNADNPNCINVTNSEGVADFEFELDDFDNLISYRDLREDMDHQSVSWRYDDKGRVINLQDNEVDYYVEYQIEYDGDRIVSISTDGDVDEKYKADYLYDQNGRIQSLNESFESDYPHKRRWEYEYDDFGNIITASLYDNEGVLREKMNYEYASK